MMFRDDNSNCYNININNYINNNNYINKTPKTAILMK